MTLRQPDSRARAAASNSSTTTRPRTSPLQHSIGRGRTQWLAMGAALVVLAGVVVAWALSSAGHRVLVVQVAQPVAAGSIIDAADLMTTGVAFDPGVEALVPAASLDALIGRVAAIDLEPGVLLQRGMWRDGEPLVAGEQAVGAVLEAGRFPLGLGVGDVVLGAPLGAAALAVGDGSAAGGLGSTGAGSASGSGTGSGTSSGSGAAAAGDASTSGAILMRVIDLVALDNGSVSVSFAVPVVDAVLVAQLSATGQLVIVREPSGSSSDPTSPDTSGSGSTAGAASDPSSGTSSAGVAP